MTIYKEAHSIEQLIIIGGPSFFQELCIPIQQHLVPAGQGLNIPQRILTYHCIIWVGRVVSLGLCFELILKNRKAGRRSHEPEERRRRVQWPSAKLRMCLQRDEIWMI